MKNTLFVIDAYNLIYRMFYAIPEITTRSWEPVNAIFGVAKFLKWLAEENPQAHIVVATDVGKTFRSDLFPEYKWTRERMPDNLRSQIDGVFAFFRAADIAVLSQEGYEADDIIGSLAHAYESESCQLVIISSDKDLCQFVRDDHVHIYDAMKRKFMKEADVIEKFGVPPSQVCDYLAIVGDSSDNIPGIAGFGPKKAEDLLSKYGSLVWIYNSIGIYDYRWSLLDGTYKGEYVIDSEKYEKSEISLKLRESLKNQVENAFLSQKLASIITDLHVADHCATDTCLADHMSRAEVVDLLKFYEFKSLIPVGSREVEKKLETIPSINITDMGRFLKLRDEILTLPERKIFLVSTQDAKVGLRIAENSYLIDLKQLDVSYEILELINHEDIEVVGYDLKTDLKNIMNFQKPLQGVEGQGKLF